MASAMVRGIAATIGFTLGLGGASACKPLRWHCAYDDQCTIEHVLPGFCEADGWCSFEDLECPSGRLYGDLAGDGLARTCVPVGADASSGSTGTGEGSGRSSTDGSSSGGSSSDGTGGSSGSSSSGG